MTEKKLQSILDELGSRVSTLTEENRTCNIRDHAAKKLVNELIQFIDTADWIKLFESCNNLFVKDLMKDWGKYKFPPNYKIK